MGDMEGGELALQVLVAPSFVAPGKGLFLCIYDDIDDDGGDAEEIGAVEEIIIPQGTPICGYARGYFADEAEEDGDKSVGFLFAGENVADVTAVFYNKQLMTLSDALWTVYQERCEEGNTDTSNLLFGHCVQISNERQVSIQADKDFMSRIFIPDVKEGDKFSPTSLGIYANDLAFDPDSNEEQYFENSERNNILQLVWRLAKDEKTGMVVPTWPVVVTKQDIRLLNTVPMEVGLQYGFKYWNAVSQVGLVSFTPFRRVSQADSASMDDGKQNFHLALLQAATSRDRERHQ
eukprot:scaffold22203_cov78-Skeletonema_dohrnii-CCMP3373.AAC.1